MVGPAETEVIRAWRPPLAGVREVFHATFASHAYPPHTHDVWTLFIVDAGAIRYDLDGRPHRADPSMVTVLPPHVVHDGRPASEAGFRKRVLYLETSVLDETLIGAAVDRPVLPEPGLRQVVSALHDSLARPDDLLEAGTRLAFLAERIGRSLGAQPPRRSLEPDVATAEHLRAWLDGHLFEPVTIAAAADGIGAGQTQAARAFSALFGIAPHRYLIGRRLEAARERILDGEPLVDVATAVGFADQAHLSRRFAQFLGTTPGRFRRAGRTP